MKLILCCPLILLLSVFPVNYAFAEDLDGMLYWTAYSTPSEDGERPLILAMDMQTGEYNVAYEGHSYLVESDLPEGCAAVVENGDGWDLLWLHSDGSYEVLMPEIETDSSVRLLAYKNGVSYFVRWPEKAAEADFINPWEVWSEDSVGGIIASPAFFAVDASGNVTHYPEYSYPEECGYHDLYNLRLIQNYSYTVSDTGLISYCEGRWEGDDWNGEIRIASVENPAISVGEGTNPMWKDENTLLFLQGNCVMCYDVGSGVVSALTDAAGREIVLEERAFATPVCVSQSGEYLIYFYLWDAKFAPRVAVKSLKTGEVRMLQFGNSHWFYLRDREWFVWNSSIQ